MAVYSYEEIYNDPTKGIIRSKEDANIVGKCNGRNVVLVCDRKWGELSQNYMEVIVGLRCNISPTPAERVWLAKDIPANDYWWAGLRNTTDRESLKEFGVTIISSHTNWNEKWWGETGTIKYEPSKFAYEVIALYTDNMATVEVNPPSDVYVSTTGYEDTLGIWGTTEFKGPFYFWKCRIRKLS